MFKAREISFCFIIFAFFFFATTAIPLYSQDNPEEGQAEELMDFMEEGMKEIDFYSLEELLDVEVEVASLFAEDELVVGSTVSSVTAEEWKMMGIRRYHEALGNEMSVIAFPTTMGSYTYSIRGYTVSGSDTGVAILVDGVPMSGIIYGSSIYTIPNWEPGTLTRIEMIKGPGSAIYGSDAFHGVISLKTFESDEDYYSIEGAGSYPLYGDGNFKISQGFMDNFIRIDATASASYQEPLDLEYEYDDPEGYDDTLFPIEEASGTSSRAFQYDSQTGILKTRIMPLDNLKIKLGAYYNRGNFDEYPGIVAIANPFDPSSDELLQCQDNDLSWTETSLYMGTGGIEYTLFNNISAEANGYYWRTDRVFKGNVLPKGWDISNTTDEEDIRTGGQFLIKQPDNALNLQWLIAYSYTKFEVEYQDIKVKIPILSFIPPVESYIEGYSRKIHSVFGQLKWGAIENRLYILLGGRNDYYSDFGNQVTPRGGLIFLPTENSSVKALYGRAFRAPSGSELKGREGLVQGDEDLKPEIIDIYELIYMYKGKKWKASVNTFYSYWKNGITMVEYYQEGFKNIYTNKGKNDSIGCELALFYPVEPLTFDLGFSFVKSRALDVKAPENTSKIVDRYYRCFPEYSANAGIYYTLKTLDLKFYLNNILYLNMREAPESVKPLPDKLPPYYRMDISVSRAATENLELYLNVKNVLNRENRMPSVLGAENGYPEPGISVMLRAGYRL